jgi:hypothetical protein
VDTCDECFELVEDCACEQVAENEEDEDGTEAEN